MTGRVIRKFLAMLVAVPLFAFLAWLFGIFFQPQGDVGAGFAAFFIFVSALVALWVYAWLVRPGPKARFRNRGVDGFDRDFGVGLLGASEHQRRRRDDGEGDDMGGRRKSGDTEEDGGEVDDGSFA